MDARRTAGGTIAACASAVALAGSAVLATAEAGSAAGFDAWAVRALRRGHDPAVPVGPAWLREVCLDVTALGSHTVVLLVTLALCTFLTMRRRRSHAWLVLAAAVGATALSAATKHAVARDRPAVVPHLREAATPSFPSGHATLAASVYLTLRAVAARTARGPYARAYCLALPAVVVVCVGVSRVYLGVHFPTDVLGGWALGASWAIACWGTADWLTRRARRQPADH